VSVRARVSFSFGEGARFDSRSSSSFHGRLSGVDDDSIGEVCQKQEVESANERRHRIERERERERDVQVDIMKSCSTTKAVFLAWRMNRLMTLAAMIRCSESR